jgi:hypothetical protein
MKHNVNGVCEGVTVEKSNATSLPESSSTETVDEVGEAAGVELQAVCSNHTWPVVPFRASGPYVMVIFWSAAVLTLVLLRKRLRTVMRGWRPLVSYAALLSGSMSRSMTVSGEPVGTMQTLLTLVIREKSNSMVGLVLSMVTACVEVALPTEGSTGEHAMLVSRKYSWSPVVSASEVIVTSRWP